MWWPLRGSTLAVHTSNILGISSAALTTTWSHTRWGLEEETGAAEMVWNHLHLRCQSWHQPLLRSRWRGRPLQNVRHRGEKAGGCEPLILPGISKRLCKGADPAPPLLCLPEANRKEGAQLLASHPSMSQLAEFAGQEAWRKKLLSSRLQ